MTDDDWKLARKKPVPVEVRGPYFTEQEVETLEGDFEIDQQYLAEHDGYYIIRGVSGEKYPIAIDIFEETYEWVDADELGIAEQALVENSTVGGL